MTTELETNEITRGETETGPTNDAVEAPERWSQTPSEAEDQLSQAAQRIAKKCQSGFLSENFDNKSDQKVPWSGSVTKVAATPEVSIFDAPGPPVPEEDARAQAQEGAIKRLLLAMGGTGLAGAAVGAGGAFGADIPLRIGAVPGALVGAGLAAATHPLRQKNRREAVQAGFPASSEGISAHMDRDFLQQLAEEFAHQHRGLYRDKQSSVKEGAPADLGGLGERAGGAVGSVVENVRSKAKTVSGLPRRAARGVQEFGRGYTRGGNKTSPTIAGVQKSVGMDVQQRTGPAGTRSGNPFKSAPTSTPKTSAIKTAARWMLIKEAMGPSPF